MSFEGMNALVTGGGSGLGLACARALSSAGATVTIVGRTEERLVAAAERLRPTAPGSADVRWAVCDVTDEAAVEKAVRVANEGDGLRVVVASAGVGWLAPIATVPLSAWQHVMETNLTGNFLTLKHAAPMMRAHGGGAYTAISSIAATLACGFLTPYNTAKAGVEHFVRSTADELGRWNIRVNAVQPGGVPTELSGSLLDMPEVRESYLDNTPIRRLGTPGDIAAAVRFLSEASWITGVCLPVDGGHHLRRGPNVESFVAEHHGTDWL